MMRSSCDSELLERAAQSSLPADLSVLTAGVMCDIAAREGLDFATALLYDRVMRSPVHGPFVRQLDSFCGAEPEHLDALDATVVVVPGAFYVEHPHTGADGQRIREQAERLGCRTDCIPLRSTGSLKENARIICDWLSARSGEPLILVSLSKGGADLKMAFAEPDAAVAFRNVVAWINLCGTLSGTPMVEWLLSWNAGAVLNRLYYRARGQSLAFLSDLRRCPGCLLDFELPLALNVLLVNVVGFPLSHHLSNGIARRCHRRLLPFGPNDGCLILADVCALPGLIYPVWGADHYLRSGRDMCGIVRAALRFLAQELSPGRSTLSGGLTCG